MIWEGTQALHPHVSDIEKRKDRPVYVTGRKEDEVLFNMRL